ncbi:MAG: glutaminyl-peptide cyclotransferase, partial [Acidobacteriota bacterium]
SPVLRPAGLGWDGSSLWMVSDQDQTIYKLDPATMAILHSIPTPAADWSFGLDHDGTNIWGDLDDPAIIYQLNGTTGALFNSFASPYQSPNGVAFDGSQVWHSAYADDLALMDPASGTVTRTIPAPGNKSPRGLEWVDGALWVVDANIYPSDAIYRVDPSDGTVLGSYQPIGALTTLIYGFAFDGRYFWLSDINTGQIHKLVIDENAIFCNGFQTGDESGWSSVVP